MDQAPFPLGAATGEAFCNRVQEREHLARNIRQARQTLLSAPRRYGKTSLVLQVMEDLEEEAIAGQTIDLFVAYDLASARRLLLSGIGRLAAQVVPVQTRALDSLKAFFGSLRPEIVLSEEGAQVRFSPVAKGPENIQDALLGLDGAVAEQGMQAVLVLDEFQQLGTLRESAALEAAIRHAAERATAVAYVFSGSSRHLLEQMFSDHNRPLYHLCDRLELQRITAKEYRPFLQKASELRWAVELADETLTRILHLTERHPYYVNLLCSRLWDGEDAPTAETVDMVWHRFVDEERNRLVNEIADLSANQRGVLAALAVEPTPQPHGQEFLQRVRLATGSVARALEVLENRDLVYRDETECLRVLDPAIAFYLRARLQG